MAEVVWRSLFERSGTKVMGILNVTPDSFSDGGLYENIDVAVERGLQMIAEGADVIDIGGESTRPGSELVDEEQELQRVIPVIEALRGKTNALISIDTYKAPVAEAALQAGANLINDVWGAKKDSRMAKVAAEFNCGIILMHNRPNMNYHSFLEDVVTDLQESVALVQASGVMPSQIILDPGIGFAKNRTHDLLLMKHLDRIVALEYPVLLATSRKRTIRNTLQLPADDVVEGTAATVALGVAKGCEMVRVHDVKQMKRVVQMMDAIMNSD